jgi:hypothetical protein
MKARVPPAIAALLIASTHAQAPTFRSSVDAVRVDVLVTDGPRPVAGLTADDFDLRDSGVVQTLDAVAVADVPISMMVALDVSDSVKGDTLNQLKKGVDAALAGLEPPDHAALLTFASDVRLRHDWAASVDQVRETVAGLRAAGGTSLWDAAFTALSRRHANHAPARAHVQRRRRHVQLAAAGIGHRESAAYRRRGLFGRNDRRSRSAPETALPLGDRTIEERPTVLD